MLAYAAIVWDSCTQELSDLIATVLYRAGKIVSGVIHWTRKELVYTEHGCVSLEECLYTDRLRVMYRMVHNDAPSYLYDSLFLSYTDDIPVIKGHTVMYENLFRPKIIIQDWSNLEKHNINEATTMK